LVRADRARAVPELVERVAEAGTRDVERRTQRERALEVGAGVTHRPRTVPEQTSHVEGLRELRIDLERGRDLVGGGAELIRLELRPPEVQVVLGDLRVEIGRARQVLDRDRAV